MGSAHPVKLTVPPEYVSEAAFCDLYGIAQRTAQRWRISGEGPPFCRFGTRRVLYRRADCESWAAAQTFPDRASEIAAEKDRNRRALISCRDPIPCAYASAHLVIGGSSTSTAPQVPGTVGRENAP